VPEPLDAVEAIKNHAVEEPPQPAEAKGKG
jgi:hypothetical protein